MAVSPRPAEAVIYRWIDAHGVVSFSNTPPVSKRLSQVKQLKEMGSPPAAENPLPGAPETAVSATGPAADTGAVVGATEEEPEPAPLPEAAAEDGEGEDLEEAGILLPATRAPLYLSQALVPAAANLEVQLSHAYLSEAVLRDVDLTEVDFRGANFVETTLQDAVLDGGDFQGAFLVNANLAGVSAQDADLRNAKLQGANLRNGDFRGSDFRGAIFAGANVEGADFYEADLSGADLRGVAGLTREQLAGAYMDDETQLPEVVAAPSPLTRSIVLTNLPPLSEGVALSR
jgi:hypothetical protein